MEDPRLSLGAIKRRLEGLNAALENRRGPLGVIPRLDQAFARVARSQSVEVRYQYLRLAHRIGNLTDDERNEFLQFALDYALDDRYSISERETAIDFFRWADYE